MSKQTNTGHATGKGQNSPLNILLTNDAINWEQIAHLDWVQAMQACEQDAIFHAEGNVYIHTQMVVEELRKSKEFTTYALEDKQKLLLAALCHDMAKPKCTVLEDGHIRSPKHALVGEKMCRELLWDVDFKFREEICALVRLHGMPVWVLERDNSNALPIASSLRLNNQDLYLLARSDMQGRICKDQDEMLMKVELFKELCQELNCLEQPKQFQNSHSRFKYFYKKEEYPAQVYDDTTFEVTMLSGLPGSGKDTYTNQFDLPIVSLDDLRQAHKVKRGDKKAEGRIIQLAYENAKEHGRKKQSFIWNSTNLTKDLRQKFISAIAPYNPKIRIVYIETSWQNVLSRRKTTIKQNALRQMRRLLEIPQLTEAHEVEYHRN